MHDRTVSKAHISINFFVRLFLTLSICLSSLRVDSRSNQLQIYFSIFHLSLSLRANFKYVICLTCSCEYSQLNDFDFIFEWLLSVPPPPSPLRSIACWHKISIQYTFLHIVYFFSISNEEKNIASNRHSINDVTCLIKNIHTHSHSAA